MLPKGIGEIRYEHTYEKVLNICPQSVFEKARGLASQLKGDENGLEKRWEMISEVWLEMLIYAEQNCEITGHEMISEVWILHWALSGPLLDMT